MKRFRFRLESVRAIRALAERSARERFGLAQQHLAATEAALRAAQLRRVELAEAINAARSGCFRPGEQSSSLSALTLARQAELDATRRRDEATTARERAREDWLAHRRRLQVIERLEEHARLAHREALDKAEQATLDELSSIAAARPSPGTA